MASSKLLFGVLFCSLSLLVRAELKIKTRETWNADPASADLTDLKLPVERVIISHTASETCNDEEACERRVRLLQDFHMNSLHFDDIGYNFLIGNDGFVYEGRGWKKVGAHTKMFNSGSIGIAFIGAFNRVQPSEAALNAAQELIAEGVKQEFLSTEYKLFGQRQLSPTSSPGDSLYFVIKKWPHWSRRLN